MNTYNNTIITNTINNTVWSVDTIIVHNITDGREEQERWET